MKRPIFIVFLVCLICFSSCQTPQPAQEFPADAQEKSTTQESSPLEHINEQTSAEKSAPEPTKESALESTKENISEPTQENTPEPNSFEPSAEKANPLEPTTEGELPLREEVLEQSPPDAALPEEMASEPASPERGTPDPTQPDPTQPEPTHETCPASQQQCGASCVDLNTNNQHCGSCNTPCTSGTTCQAGSCQCPLGGCGLSQLNDEFSGSNLSGWQIMNPNASTRQVSGGSLHITPSTSLWYNATATGTFVWKPIDGDFIATAYVITRRTSSPSLPPATPYRLGGLMARNPSTAQGQNYVFLVLGADQNDPSVEHKSTVNSVSTFVGPSWPSGEGELRLCRLGSSFYLFIRSRGGNWQQQVQFNRTDLPNTLHVGPVTYANTTPPDLRVSFEYVRFDRPVTLADCTRP